MKITIDVQQRAFERFRADGEVRHPADMEKVIRKLLTAEVKRRASYKSSPIQVSESITLSPLRDSGVA